MEQPETGGTGIRGLQDDFRFVYQIMKGDFEISGRVDSLTNLSENVNSGLMIRESVLENAKFAYLCINPAGKISFGYRKEGMANLNQSQKFKIYGYLKVVKESDNITAYISKDGADWEQVGIV